MHAGLSLRGDGESHATEFLWERDTLCARNLVSRRTDDEPDDITLSIHKDLIDRLWVNGDRQ